MIDVSIVGGSGFSGGELLRLLLFHPEVTIKQVTANRQVGKLLSKVHPNLRKQTQLKFCSVDELEPCDVLFVCLPHGHSQESMEKLRTIAPKIIDLGADYRLDAAGHEKWYGEHADSENVDAFVYGLPELHREELRKASFAASPGCNATATILALYPLYKRGLIDTEKTVVEVKAGSSEAGNTPNEGSHHPIRSGVVRSYKPVGHRHSAEIEQELGKPVHLSVTSIEMVRGILATCHVFLTKDLTEKDIWKIYREEYGEEPFIRIVKDKEGSYRHPEPKILSGTNFCDIGFVVDPHSNRVVVISAIDNLMKGAAGQAVQAMNLMCGFEETTALTFPGLHPI